MNNTAVSFFIFFCFSYIKTHFTISFERFSIYKSSVVARFSHPITFILLSRVKWPYMEIDTSFNSVYQHLHCLYKHTHNTHTPKLKSGRHTLIFDATCILSANTRRNIDWFLYIFNNIICGDWRQEVLSRKFSQCVCLYNDIKSCCLPSHFSFCNTNIILKDVINFRQPATERRSFYLAGTAETPQINRTHTRFTMSFQKYVIS